ncbi:hypothetical protein QM565_36085 [Geitlerinema splendidum]|nr:hypothetical protein [Geitlerinema splendidum]
MKKFWILLVSAMLLTLAVGCSKQGEATDGDGGSATIEKTETEGAVNPDAGASEGP